MTAKPKTYRHFAFISYSRKDSKAAAWLQKRLEWFRFPVKLVPEDRRPPNPRYIQPIYRDKTNLEVTTEHYWINIRRALEESRYLIVLCSPNSAKPRPGAEIHPVNMEVVHFLETHGEDASLVAPIILSGDVTSDGDDAALCPALRQVGSLLTNRNLPTMVPDGDSPDERDAWESGFVSLISYLLQLKRDSVGDHIQRESRRQARNLRLWIGAVALLAAVAISAGWIAVRQLAETERQLERSEFEQGRAWLERARAAKEKGDHLTALMFAGRAVGFQGYGRREKEELGIDATYPLLLGKPLLSDPQIEQQRQKVVKQVAKFVDSVRPTTLPIWSSPSLTHHSSSVTSVAYCLASSLLASGSSDHTVKLWDAVTGKELATFSAHSESVASVAFSPDGTRLASGSEDATVKLWDVVSGKVVASFSGHSAGVASVSFSPDGTKLASGSSDKTVKLWDLVTGKEIETFSGHSEGVTSVAFSPDGSYLASGAGVTFSADGSRISSGSTSLQRPGEVKLWNLSQGKKPIAFSGHSATVTCVAFSPDGSHLASGSWDKKVKIWSTATGKELSVLTAHSGPITSVAFSLDGLHIATGSEDKTIKLWEVAMNKEVASFSGHSASVTSVAFSPEGKNLASGSEDMTIRLWDVSTGQGLTKLSGHSSGVAGVALSPDGSKIASGSWDETVKVWDLDTGKELNTFSGHSGSVTSVAFSPDGNLLASGSEDKTVKLWDLVTGKEINFKHSDGVTSVAFSPDGSLLASGSEDKTVKLWELATGKERTFFKHPDVVTSVAFSPDGTLLASSGSGDNSVKLWNTDTGKELPSFSGHSGKVTSIAFSPDGSRLASGSEDMSIRLWSIATGKEEATFSGHSDYVTSVAFSPDGNHLASGGQDTTIRLWEISTGKQLASFSGNAHLITSVVFHQDGKRLISGSGDKTVKVWDIALSNETVTFSGHSSGVTSLAFSPKGGIIASGSEDYTVKLWDTATGRELTAFYGHSGNVTSVAFSPDGRLLASGSESVDQPGEIRLWDLATGKEVANISGHSKGVVSVVFSPDGNRLASASIDHTVKLWDTTTRRKLDTFSVDVTSIAFSPNGSLLAIGSGDNTVKLWDIGAGKEIGSCIGHSQTVTSVAFSPDGNHLASGSYDRTVRLWDISSGIAITTFVGHKGGVESVAFSNDGRHIASGSDEFDPTVKLWNVVTGEEIESFNGHSTVVSCVAFSPDGEKVASGSWEGTLKLWMRTNDSETDLLATERNGFIKPSGDGLQWNINTSLFTDRHFSPLHRRMDTLKPFAAELLGPAQDLRLRMNLCAQSLQWRALLSIWQSSYPRGIAEDPNIRHEFLLLLLEVINSFSAVDPPHLPQELIGASETALQDLTALDFQDHRLTLALSETTRLILRDSKLQIGIGNSVAKLLVKAAPFDWLSVVCEKISEEQIDEPNDEPAKPEQVSFIEAIAEAYPNSLSMLRSRIRYRTLSESGWKTLVNQMFNMRDATLSDYLTAAQSVAKSTKLRGVANEILNQTEARFSGDSSVHLKIGGLRLHFLEDAKSAIRNLEAAKASIERFTKPHTQLLLDLALAQWLDNQQVAAIETYKLLIEAGSMLEKPEDWTESRIFRRRDLPESEWNQLDALLISTLKKHPDLKRNSDSLRFQVQ